MDENWLLAGLFIGAGLAILSSNAIPSFEPYPPDENDSSTVQPQTTSEGEILYIEQAEGFSATPYPDAGHLDIGYGHQIQPGESYTTMSQAEAETLLRSDLGPVEQAILENVTVPLSQNQFDALADFIYNVGIGAFQNSTLLQLLNNGDYAGASAQFSRWVYSKGVIVPALQTRRQTDQLIFNG